MVWNVALPPTGYRRILTPKHTFYFTLSLRTGVVPLEQCTPVGCLGL